MRRGGVVGTVLAVAMVVGGGLALRPTVPPEPTGGAVRVLRGGAEVEVSGPLATALAVPLRQALARGARMVQVDSPGGPAGAAEALAAEIRAVAADTAVTDRCLSACVALFLAGQRRWIGPFAQLGLEARHAGGSLLETYRRAGVPPALLRDVGMTPDGQGWFPTGDDLLANGMATGTAAPDQFALAGFGPAPTAESIRTRLLSVPLYQAAARADPATFEADLVAWHDAVLRGEPGTAAFAGTRSTIRSLVRRALRDASDDTVRAYVEVLAAQVAWARQRRPEMCLDPLYGSPDGSATDPDLAARRAELDLRLLQGLSASPLPAASSVAGPSPPFTSCDEFQQTVAAAARDMPALRLLARRL